MWGFVFQGKAYEGLTCNALEWIDSFGGGRSSTPTARSPSTTRKAAAGADLGRLRVGTIAPEGVLNYSEEEARGVFQSGNAVFMRNWPYAWALGKAAGQPDQGQDRRGGPAGRRRRRQAHRHARRLAARGLELQQATRTRRPTSCAT